MVTTNIPHLYVVLVDKLSRNPIIRNDTFKLVHDFLPKSSLIQREFDDDGRPMHDEQQEPEKIREHLCELYGNLFRVVHGESVYVWEEEIREQQYHFKNGKLRKEPLIISEMSYNEVKGYIGELSHRWAIWRELRKLRSFCMDKYMDRTLSDRCKLIMVMLKHEDLEITYTLSKHEGRFLLNANYNRNSHRLGQAMLREEIYGIIPRPLLEDYHTQKRLHEFKFIVREGFLDELHCPRDFWEIQKLCICGGEWRGYVPVQIEEGRKPVIVRMDFGLDAAQPIRKVVFTDEPVSENPDLDGIKPAAFNTIEPKLFRGAEDLGGILPVESIVRNFVKEGGLVVDNTE